MASDVDSLLSRQHGVVSRAQALDRGISRDQIHRLLRRGTWLTLVPGVYTVASSVPTWRRQLTAAILSRPVAIVAGRSAAHLLGFGGFHRTRPEIMVPFEGNARSPLARVLRSRHFDLIETRKVDGFVCTTPAETILSLCYSMDASVVERMVDDRLAARSLDIEDFDPIFARLSHAPIRRVAILKRIVGERDGDAYQPPTSELERSLYPLLEREGIPPYLRQVPFAFAQVDATVDAFIPEWSTIVEADGRRWHSRVEDFERDRQRDNAALAAGLVVVRFTYRMLRNKPELCLKTLLDVGGHRSQ